MEVRCHHVRKGEVMIPDENDDGAPDSPTWMPVLETERLFIRPYRPGDVDDLHRILDREIEGDSSPEARDRRERYVRWSVTNYRELALLNQPPYGDRAIVRKEDGALVGACGLTPSMGPFGLLPSFPDVPEAARRLFLPATGLFYALSPSVRGQGYATEAARALVEFAFEALQQWRVVATTTYDNEASMRVMRRLGMRVERNVDGEPPWFQVVGVIENPNLRGR